MNIQSNFNPVPYVQPTPTVGRATGSSPASDAAPAPAESFAGLDSTSLSQASLLASASSGASDVRSEKVAAVQQALAGGSYAVSASDVAGKLIDHLLQG